MLAERDRARLVGLLLGLAAVLDRVLVLGIGRFLARLVQIGLRRRVLVGRVAIGLRFLGGRPAPTPP